MENINKKNFTSEDDLNFGAVLKIIYAKWFQVVF
jgi:hypothetical protein